MKLLIRNFRSIEKQEIETAPITVVYGPNSSGKSSLLYSLLTLKNIVLNPNQHLEAFFNYQFTNLGGLREVTYNHDLKKELELGIGFNHESFEFDYRIIFKDTSATFSLDFSGPNDITGSLKLPVSFPYPLNQRPSFPLKGKPVIIIWNGVTADLVVQKSEIPQEAKSLAAILNAHVERLRGVSFVPLRRGFSQPQYYKPAMSPFAISEGEVASLLADDKYLTYRVSHLIEKIFNKDLRLNTLIGTGVFSLDITDKESGMGVELVNEGFGINQVVYLLTKALHPDAKLVCVEEPEVHLNPTIIRRLAQTMVELTKDDDKQFLISTHSEPFVIALLAAVAREELAPSDIAFYLAVKPKKATTFQRQNVNEKGQIEGGLRAFIEGELEDVKDFLRV